MAARLWTSAICTAALLLGTVRTAPQPSCKPNPGSSGWPVVSDWQALNQTISGRLIAPVPPGLACQTNSSLYNAAACSNVYQQWGNSSWHAMDPFTADYNDDACLPSDQAPCSAAAYPAYVVNATNAGHVQAAVAFARNTGIRLIVKGTGHDISGRSSGPGSLSIWTHNIRGVNVSIGDARAQKYGGSAAVTIAAGMRMGEIYAAVAEHNVTVVGGSDPDVGIGGWITGGGHSPISSKYGLGADQALEMEVVTANGTLLTINETSYPGLFWAMRGGGGSTFAVLISVTVRAYPGFGTTLYTFSYNTTSNTDTFWSLAAYFHSQLPTLSDDGVMGYYWVSPDTGPGADPAVRGSLYGVWLLPEKTVEQSQKIIAPMEQVIRNNTMKWADPVRLDNYTLFGPDFTSIWSMNTPESVGLELRLGSRLLGRKALETDLQTLKTQLKKTTSNPLYSILGHLVAGQGVKNVKIPGGSNAVLPAWRSAYVHIVLPRTWQYLNETDKIATTNKLRNVEVEALRQLAPDSGAYVNEADPTEPNWQQAFWGTNYPRLLQLKNYWDPAGVFWCIPCVGHGQWTVESDYGIEGGIGQTPGRICKS